MPVVNSSDVKSMLENSDSKYFQIFFIGDEQAFAWTYAGFLRFNPADEDPLIESQIFSRYEVEKQYYHASRDAETIPFNGVLSIVPLPIYTK